MTEKNFEIMSVTELDRLYWEVYGNMRNCKDRKSYREYCETGEKIVKELERRGIVSISDIAAKIKEENMFN